MIEEHSLQQHVREATCRTGNILDLILTPDGKSYISGIAVHDVGLSDHSLVTCKISEATIKPSIITSTFRCWKRLDHDLFRTRLLSSSVYQSPAATANYFAEQLRSDTVSILNELVPFRKVARRISKLKNVWLSEEALKAKRMRRQLERRWKSTGYEAVRRAYRDACKSANRLINDSRRSFYSQRVQESSHDPRKLWRTVKDILHTNCPSSNQPGLCNAFATHIITKLDMVKRSVAVCTSQMAPGNAFSERKASDCSLEFLNQPQKPR